MSSDFDGLDIFPAPCSRYEQFVNLYSNINKNQPRRAHFAAAQAQWTSAKNAGRVYTVVQAMKENLQSRGSNVESQKSKFRSFFSAKHHVDAGIYSHASVYNKPPRIGYFNHNVVGRTSRLFCRRGGWINVYKTCNVCLKAFPSAHYLTM